MSVVSLSPVDLSIAASMVLAAAALSFWQQLSISKRFLIAAIRTVIQLLLIGLVLKWLFAQQTLYWVIAWGLVILLVAGREAIVRQQYRFIGGWSYKLSTFSIFVSSFSVSFFVLLTVIQQTPWYLPQYAIPLLSMVIGNTMTAVALALDQLTTQTWQQRAVLENRLALGETSKQAITDIKRNSIRVGMIPIINAMATAGLVNLPGMMTGQILSGVSPLEAVKYQILIMFMISTGAALGSVIAISIGARHLFDERQRLRTDRLQAGTAQ